MENILAARIDPRIALGAILLLGLVLRVWGIDFGLPYLFHADEGFEVQRALQLGSGSFDFDRIAKGGYFYLLFLEYGVFFALAWLSGIVSSAEDFARLYITDPSYFYLIGRYTSAVLGTATIFYLYKLCERAGLGRFALAAALLLAVNPLHVAQCHYIVVDVPLIFLCVYAFYLFSRLNAQSSRLFYAWIGAVIAMAAFTKLPGIVLILPLILLHVTNTKTDSRVWWRAILEPKLLLAGASFTVVFFGWKSGSNSEFFAVRGSDFTDYSRAIY